MVNCSRLAVMAVMTGLASALPRDYTPAEIAALVPDGDVIMDLKTVGSERFNGKFGMSRLVNVHYNFSSRAFCCSTIVTDRLTAIPVTFVPADGNDQVLFAAVVDQTDGFRLETTTYSTSNSLVVIDSEGYGRNALALGCRRGDAPSIFNIYGVNDTAQGTPVTFDTNNFAIIHPAGDFLGEAVHLPAKGKLTI